MSTPTSRVGDMFVGICCCHPPAPCIGMAGIIVAGSPDVTVEGSPQARIGDAGIGFCGHGTVLVSGASKTFANNIPCSRIGDAVAGCIAGTMVTGASKTFIE